MQKSLFRQSLVLIIFPFALEVLILACLFVTFDSSEQCSVREQQIRQSLNEVDAIKRSLEFAVQKIAKTVLLNDQQSIDEYKPYMKSLPDRFDNLHIALTGFDEMTDELDKIQLSVNEVRHLMNTTASLYLKGGRDTDGTELGELKTKLIPALNELESFRDGLRELSDVLMAEHAKNSSNFKLILMVGLCLNLLLGILLLLYFKKRITKRLSFITANAKRLAKGEELNPPIGGADEIAELDHVFTNMASELEQARQKESIIIENAKDVICSIDIDGTFTAVSPASFKAWGYSPEKLIGQTYTDIIIDEDKDRAAKPGREETTGKTSFAFESRVGRGDGSVVDVLWSSRWSDKAQSLICIAHDITDRKRAERLLKESETRVRLIIESMPVGLILTDEHGKIQMVNPATTAMLGYTQTDLIDHHFMTLFSSALEETQEGFMNEILTNALGKTYQREAVGGNGAVIPVEFSLTRFNALGKECLLAALIDISERKEIERLKQEFVAMISHDLRTPLTSIQVFIDVLKRERFGTLSETGHDRASLASRNIARILQLVSNLLDIEKLESGLFDLHCEDTGIRELVDKATDSVEALAASKNILIEKVDLIDATVCIDSESIVQVLVNLLGNALKFSPDDSTISISAEKNSDYTMIKVIDRGRGIPAELKGAIFDRFRQVELKDRTDKKGSGLGLSICKAIVERHAGEIGCDSEEGKGSTFWFRLPLTKSNGN